MPLPQPDPAIRGCRAFSRVLVANRGEIACRVLRALRELGIEAVAVYSDADAAALHVSMADAAYRIGPPPARDSYLSITRVLDAARQARVDAIHPGYGFLSENPAFSAACEDAGFTFIGPPTRVIEMLGNKVTAREVARRAGVATVPGSAGPVADGVEAARVAARIGYPVLVKAVAGGGGKGMRVVWSAGDLDDALARASSEAQAAFGDASVYMEKHLPGPHHVEVQVVADTLGHVVHLHERECSVQRRHQKLVEETPSPAIDDATRARITQAAVSIAREAGYVGAGTVEFLVDGTGAFYFLEVNTRLQVEHPVTEMVTGLDLVKMQISIAQGEPLAVDAGQVRPRGAAIECRIYAEDPENGFLPSPGRITLYRGPSGPWVREDTGFYEGAEVPRFYDPLLAKLITWGTDRREAIARMRAALADTAILGVRTTIPFHTRALALSAFERGDVTTDFIDRHREDLMRPAGVALEEVATVAAALERARHGMVLPDRPPGRSAWCDGGRRRAQIGSWAQRG